MLTNDVANTLAELVDGAPHTIHSLLAPPLTLHNYFLFLLEEVEVGATQCLQMKERLLSELVSLLL